ncbi:MAG: hypothetical protein KTR31_41625, partial [Myxococcales bacterium]|nr:hypothetical protein [Myxococcales bacterium]
LGRDPDQNSLIVRVYAGSGKIADMLRSDFFGQSAPNSVERDTWAVGFQLLALRGSLWLGTAEEHTVDLDEGVTVHLAPGLAVEVVERTLPDVVVAARIDGGSSQFLWADVYSVMPNRRAELVPGYQAHAAGWLSPSAGQWQFQPAGRAPAPFRPGDVWELGEGHSLEAVAVPTQDAHLQITQSAVEQLTVLGRTDTAHLHRQGRSPLVLTGLQARMITELGLIGTSVDWRVLAQGLWPTDLEPDRDKYDQLTRRLRIKLRDHGIRTDLVRPTNTGMVELYLHRMDRFVDEA